METTFGRALSQFVKWYKDEFDITLAPTTWFENTSGFDKKYLTRWTKSGLLPSGGNWDQFTRKVCEGKEEHPELQKRIRALTSLLDSVRVRGIKQRQLRHPRKVQIPSGSVEYFSDIVDIVNLWQELFHDSRSLDLVVMYASTWRNTYLKHVREMLRKPGSCVRVVLPQPNANILRAYSSRLNIPVNALLSRIDDAFREFRDLGKYGKVRIYRISYYMNHAMYMFDSCCVMGLYSFRADRCPTPALIIKDADLLEFVRRDFQWLVSKKNRASRLVFASK